MNWQTRAIYPDWPAPAGVHALMTTRLGGASRAPYDSFNLAAHVGDDPRNVAANRSLLRAVLPAEPLWLTQVHGTAVVDAAQAQQDVEADASVAFAPGVVCVVNTADCLPVLFARADGSAVGAAHAGWRGLCDGVIEATVERLGAPQTLLAWMGAAIGPGAFEVGDEVRAAFVARDAGAGGAFHPSTEPGKWRADLYELARRRLAAIGVSRVYGGGVCTASDLARFYSFRRDGATGRMSSLIWLG